MEATAAMPPAERAVSFSAQKVWKRALIVLAGPVANFILAIVIFSGVFFVYGRGIMAPRIATVMPGEAAATAGFPAGRRDRLDQRHTDCELGGHAAHRASFGDGR